MSSSGPLSTSSASAAPEMGVSSSPPAAALLRHRRVVAVRIDLDRDGDRLRGTATAR